MRPSIRYLCVASLAFGGLVAFTACGGPEPPDHESSQSNLLKSGCRDDCPDPAPATSVAFTGGGAAVDTTTTAARPKAEQAARDSACKAAKDSIVPPACHDPVRCKASSGESCTYANLQCPVSGQFGDDLDAWIEACKASNEPQAWKDQNCNRRNGPAGKPAYVLCTVDATATATTVCTPRRRWLVCEDPKPIDRVSDAYGEEGP